VVGGRREELCLRGGIGGKEVVSFGVCGSCSAGGIVLGLYCSGSLFFAASSCGWPLGADDKRDGKRLMRASGVV
jgi:hypothetical protein